MLTGVDDTTPYQENRYQRTETYRDLTYVYSSDSYEISLLSGNNSNQKPGKLVSLLKAKTPIYVSVGTLSNTSRLLDHQLSEYTYGMDYVYINGEKLNAEDFSWSLPTITDNGKMRLADSPPKQSNLSAVFLSKDQYSCNYSFSSNGFEKTMVIDKTNSDWYLSDFSNSVNLAYRGEDQSNFYNIESFKYSYNIKDKTCYSIEDSINLRVILYPTDHVLQLIGDSDRFNIRTFAFLDLKNEDSSPQERDPNSGVGNISFNEEINQLDIEQYGYLPCMRKTVEQVVEDNPYETTLQMSTYYTNDSISKINDDIHIKSQIDIRALYNYPQMDMLGEIDKQTAYNSNFDRTTKGTVFLLMPKGSRFNGINDFHNGNETFDPSSIEYSVNTQENYKNTGRQLVKITYNIPIPISVHNYQSGISVPSVCRSYHPISYYNFRTIISFNSVYPVENIAQYGRKYKIEAAYTNEYMNDAIGSTKDVADWVEFSSDAKKVFYNIIGQAANKENSITYATYEPTISLDVSYIAGPKHAISTSAAPAYADTATASLGEDYSYRLAYRTANDGSKTTASDMVLFSTLGLNDIDTSAMGDDFASNPAIPHLMSVSTYQLEDMGISPSIYYSTQDLDLSNSSNTDITDSTKWIPASSPEDPALANARRLAIDCTKTSDGSPFILEAGKYIEAFANMSAPISSEALPDTFTSDMFVQGAIAGATGEGTSITTTKASSVTLNLKDLPISISKSASPAAGDTDNSAAYVQRNQDLDYTITVSNSSNTDYKNIVVEDILPKQFIPNDDGSWASIVQQDGTETPIVNLLDVFSYDGDTRTAQITLSSIPRGDSIDIRLHGTVAPDANGTFSNTARLKRISSSVGIASDEIDVSSNEVFHKVLDIGGRKILKNGSLPLDGEFGFSLIRERDTLVDKNIGERIGGGDGVPDKYQIALTYEVQNGKASFDQVVLTKRNDAGELDETGYATLQENDIPIFTPNEGYDEKMWIIGSEPQVGQQYRDSYDMVLSFLRSDADIDTGNGEVPVAPDIEMPLNESTKPLLHSSRKLSTIESRNDENGLFFFDTEQMTADNATSVKNGTYVHRFIMSEQDEGAQGVTYDDSRYMAEVISTDVDNDGTLEIQDVKYYKMALDGSLAEVDEAVFVNERALPIQLAATGQNGIFALIGAGAVLIIAGSIIVGRSRHRKQEAMYKIEHTC